MNKQIGLVLVAAVMLVAVGAVMMVHTVQFAKAFHHELCFHLIGCYSEGDDPWDHPPDEGGGDNGGG